MDYETYQDELAGQQDAFWDSVYDTCAMDLMLWLEGGKWCKAYPKWFGDFQESLNHKLHGDLKTGVYVEGRNDVVKELCESEEDIATTGRVPGECAHMDWGPVLSRIIKSCHGPADTSEFELYLMSWLAGDEMPEDCPEWFSRFERGFYEKMSKTLSRISGKHLEASQMREDAAELYKKGLQDGREEFLMQIEEYCINGKKGRQSPQMERVKAAMRWLYERKPHFFTKTSQEEAENG